MATGALSSLGLGSGTLTSDVIDKLKEADKSILVKPIERKLEDNKSKTTELSTLTTLLATLKTSTSTLSDDTNYLKRSTSVTGDSVKTTVSAGVSMQDIDVSVKQLAKQSIFESSNTFSKMDENVLSSGSDSTFSFYVGSAKTSISLGDGAISLSKLVEEINNQANDKVTASIMNVGGDNPYKLIIKAKGSGDSNQVYFGEKLEGNSVVSNNLKTGMSINGVDIVTSDKSYTSLSDMIDAINEKIDETNVKAYKNGDSIIFQSLDGSAIDLEDANAGADWLNLGFSINVGSSEVSAISDSGNDKTRTIIDGIGINMLQKSQDAKFTFNGVNVTRSKNTVDDLVTGLTMELQKTDLSGNSSTIKIKRDDTGMIDTIKEMVASYNQVLNKLNEITDYNKDTGTAGIFQGESTVSRIKSSLNRILLTSDFTQDIHNLIELGLELNEFGMLSFNESKLQSKLSANPEGVEKIFKGYSASVRGESVTFDGIFAKMNKELNGLVGDKGSLTLFDTNLKSNKTKLDKERETAIGRLDVRYEIMSSKFAAYDSMISSMNAGFKSLQMQIDTMTAQK